MKVLLANDEKGMRGGEFQTLLLARGLSEKGCEVTIAAREGSSLAAVIASPVGSETFPFEDAPFVTPVRLSRLIARWRPDILHAQTSDAHTHLWLARTLTRGAPPLVVSRRVAFPVKRDPFSLLKYGAGVAHYVPISSAAAASLSHVGIRPGKMTVIPSGVDVVRFRDARGRRDLASKWGLDAGAVVIGTIGAFEVEKGHAALLEAAAEVARGHPEARFILMGSGRLEKAVSRMISSLGLGASAKCVPPESPLEEVLPLFHVFVLPSLSEGLSTALIAAMAAGLPIVASDAGGIPEVVAPGCGILVPPGNAVEMARALRRLIDDESLRRSMGEEGRRRAAEFDISITVERTLELYQRVLRVGG